MNDNASAFCAFEYDEKIRQTLPYYEEFHKQILDIVKAHVKNPPVWLDIGCGTGKMAELALGQADIEKYVFCDKSETMIKIAKQRFERENTEFVTASILELQSSIPYHVITVIQVFHYLTKEERIKAVRKCYEMLHTNGIFITFENFAPFSEAGKQLLFERWKLYQLSQGKEPAECREHIGRYGNEYFPVSITGHLEILHQCGFQNAEVIWVSNMQAGFLGIK